ncbi:class I SAM-dependent methyltransferase [Candidatus Rariloculus sp.]|uniref:class I SAM-dependent methyltransferase n=1 Tax=Candidatus Rariloculus sp. TaxID=3101265 RepID=UPI003D1043C4
MSGFSPEWLAAREPVDERSRPARLAHLLRERLAAHETIAAVDLGAGTGANLRYLAPRLGGRQDWQLVDDDPRVLEAAGRFMRGWADGWGAELTEMPGGFVVRGKSLQCRARRLTMNLATDFAKLLLPESALVTCSALLDLVSESWLRGVAARCRDSGAIVMFALTYDGHMSFKPEDSEDAHVRSLVNRHQLTDKGFGPALGPSALDTAETIFAELGYRVRRERSDWRLGAGDRQLWAPLLEDWLKAAVAMEEDSRHALSLWQHRRRAALDARSSELVVGHEDLLAYLPE